MVQWWYLCVSIGLIIIPPEQRLLSFLANWLGPIAAIMFQCNVCCKQTVSIVSLILVLHDISIYQIDIECEPKTDYEQCLNQYWIILKIDIKWQNRQKSVWFLKYWITFWFNLCKDCSFCQFWGIFGGILGMFAQTNYIRNQIWKSWYRIGLKKLQH